MAALTQPLPRRIAVDFYQWVAARRGRGGPSRSPRLPVHTLPIVAIAPLGMVADKNRLAEGNSLAHVRGRLGMS